MPSASKSKAPGSWLTVLSMPSSCLMSRSQKSVRVKNIWLILISRRLIFKLIPCTVESGPIKGRGPSPGPDKFLKEWPLRAGSQGKRISHYHRWILCIQVGPEQSGMNLSWLSKTIQDCLRHSKTKSSGSQLTWTRLGCEIQSNHPESHKCFNEIQENNEAFWHKSIQLKHRKWHTRQEKSWLSDLQSKCMKGQEKTTIKWWQRTRAWKASLQSMRWRFRFWKRTWKHWANSYKKRR